MLIPNEKKKHHLKKKCSTIININHMKTHVMI